MDEMDSRELGRFIEHLVTDYAGGAAEEHLRELIFAAIEPGPKHAYLVLCGIIGITAKTLRSSMAEQLAAIEAAATSQPFFVLGAELSEGVDLEPHVRARVVAAQALTAALNDDAATTAALFMPVVHGDPEQIPAVIVGALQLFAEIYNTEAGHRAWNHLHGRFDS